MVTLDVNPFETSDVQNNAEFESVSQQNEFLLHDVMATPANISPRKTVFQCDKCTYQSHSQELFDRHATRHLKDRPFDCPNCDYKVLDHSMFVGHLGFHQRSESIQCPFCPYASRASTMKLHMLKHRALEVFDCSACEFSTNNPKSLTRHAELYHTQMFKCEYCKPPNLTRMPKQSLIEHWNEVHGIREVSFEPADAASVQRNITTLSKPDSSRSMDPEVVVKSEYPQDTEDRIATSPDARGLNGIEPTTHFVSGGFTDDDTDQTNDCPICEFSSPLKVLLKYHILSMHTLKFPCKRCSAVMTKHALIQHSKNAHGIHMYFNGKGLQKVSSQSEMRVVDAYPTNYPEFGTHPGEHQVPRHVPGGYRRPVFRTESEESSVHLEMDVDRVDALSSSEVSRYIVLEQGQFLCSVCKHAPLTRSKLELHVKNVHVKKYHCKYCPVIMSRFDLIKHSMTMHGVHMSVKTRGLKAVGEDLVETSQAVNDQGFNAGVDGNYYGTSPSLNHGGTQDERSCVTGGIKPFACSICDFSSHTEWGLTCHMKFMHTTKYHCNHCPVIMTKYDVIKHSLREHGIEIRPRGPSGLREARDSEPQGEVHNFVGLEDTKFATDRFSSDGFASHFMHEPSHSTPNGLVKTDNPFSCAICNFTAKSYWNLMKHVVMFHRKKYCCPHCPAIMNKHKLIDHGFTAHGISIKAKNRFLKEVAQDSDSSDSDSNAYCSDSEIFEYHGEQLPRVETVSSHNSLPKTVCSFCSYTSPSAYHVQVHVENMHVVKYHCEYCSVVMPKYDLIQHYKNEHRVVVSNRDYRFKKAVEGMNGHGWENPVIKTESDPEYTPGPSPLPKKNAQNTSRKGCSQCGYKSVIQKDVRMHEERMHRLKFHCDRCPVVMVKYDLLRHYKIEHGIMVPNNRRFRQAENVGGQESEDQRELNRENSMFDESSVRGNSAGNVTCSFCGCRAKRSSLPLHVERMHSRKYRCDHCTAVMTKYELIEHYKNVHGLTIYNRTMGLQLVEAGTVDATGSQRGTAEPEHPQFTEENDGTNESSMKVTRTEAESCSMCDFSSKSSRSLELHIENWHKRKYVCKDCPAVMTKHEIIEHSKDVHGVIIPKRGGHTQTMKPAEEDPVEDTVVDNHENPRYTDCGFKVDAARDVFKCDYCVYSSAHRKSVLSHVINMHRKKYTCNDCSAVMSKYELIPHSKDAHGVEIPWNGRGYVFKLVNNQEPNDDFQISKNSSVSSLNVEIVEGTSKQESAISPNGNTFLEADGRYDCADCEFTTSYPSNLNIHVENLHTKLFCCDKCPAVKNKCELVQHYEKEHNILPGKRARFREYQSESGQANSESSESYPPTDTDRHSPMGFESTMNDQAKEQSESIRIGQNNSSADGVEIVLRIGDRFKCALCEHSSQWKNSVQGHFESFHSKKYSCVRCSVIMTKYEMIQHYEIEHDVVIEKSGRGPTGRFYREVSNMSDDMDESADEVSSCLEEDTSSGAEMNTDDNDGNMTGFPEGEESKCSICSFSTTFKSNLKRHIECFHRNKYSCSRCSMVSTKYGIIRHYEKTHRFVIPNFGKGNLAPYCKPISDFSKDADSSFFAEAVMDDPVTDEIDGDTNDDDEAVIEEDGLFRCAVCGHSSDRKGNLLSHVKAVHKKKYSCNRCPKIATKYDMVRHYETDHDVVIRQLGKTQPCFVAVASTLGSSSSSLFPQDDGHRSAGAEDDYLSGLDIVQEGEDFKCPVCSHTSNQKGNMKTHIEVFHKKKFTCNRCSVILSKYEMIRHYEADHNVEIHKSGRGRRSQYFREVDQDPEASNACDGSVTDNNCTGELHSADGNVTIIREGGVFRCSVCSYSSCKKANVGAHLNAHHNKLYSCNKCSAVMTKYEMVNHYETDHDVTVPNQGLGAGGVAKFCKAIDQDPGDWNPPVMARSKPENSESEPVAIDGRSSVEIETDAVNDVGFVFEDGSEFKCSLCEYSTTSKGVAEKHLISLHKKKFSCNRCSVVMTKYNMLQHFEADHGVEIPYNGRGLTAQYFTQVGSDVASLSPSELQHPSATASTSEGVEVPGTDEFKCTLCDHSTKYKANLKFHEESLHSKKFVCNSCSVIMTKHEMLQHCENEHGVVIRKSANSNHTCLHFVEASPDADDTSSLMDSESTISTDSAANPAREGGGSLLNPKEAKDFACNICGFSTQHEKSMGLHMVNCHKRKYACDHCQKVCTKHSLVKHCKNVHGVTLSIYNHNLREVKSARKGFADGGSTSDNLRPSPGSSGITFRCSSCDFSSKLRMHLQVHTKNMHFTKHSCNICSEEMTKYELIGHCRNVHSTAASSTHADLGSSKECDHVSDVEAMQARNTFDCTICSFTTKAKWYLKDHMKKFHKALYYCSHCPAVLTKHALIKHCKKVHDVVYSSRQNFREASDANASISLAKDGEGSETGRYQGTSTTSDARHASSLESNNSQADQEVSDRAQCPKCDFSTPNKWYLKGHMESFHAKKFCCSQCPAVMTKHELVKHSRDKHGMNLKRMGKLPPGFKASREHARSKPPKRFPCAKCSFSSSHSFGLKRHVKIHHTIKYPCHRCSAVLTRYELIKHCRNSHNTQNHLGSQVVNPKFQTALPSALETIESPAFQPVVALERLPIDHI